MSLSAPFPSNARWLIAAFASLLLIIWTLLGPGLPPLRVSIGAKGISPYPVVFSAVLATTIRVALAPIVWHGSRPERGAGFLLGLFPLLVLGVIVLWTVGLSRTTSS